MNTRHRLTFSALALLAACSTTKSDTREQQLALYTENAQVYYQMGEYERAEDQAMKGLDLDPESTKLRLILGWTLQKRGRTEDVLHAERVFRSVIDTDDFRAPLGLATALEREGSAYAEAATAIQSGKRITESPDPVARAAELEQKSHAAWTESLQWYARTLELQKENTDALNGSMRVEALLGRLEKSVEYAERLLAASRTDRAFWEKRIEKPQVTVDEEDSYRKFARSLTTTELATHLHAAGLLVTLQRPKDALAHLDAAVALAPDRPDIFARRAQVQKDLQHWDAAIQDLEKFIRLSPEPFDHPDIQRAWQLHRECAAASKNHA